MPTTRMRVATALSVLLLTGAPGTLATAATTAEVGAVDAPLDALVVEPPSPVPGTDRARHLVYEVLLRNVTAVALRVERLDVVDARWSRSLATYSRSEVERVLLVASDAGVRPGGVVPPGAFALVVLDVRLQDGQPAPAGVEHRFVLMPEGDVRAAPRMVTIAPTPVGTRAPASVSAPLHLDHLVVLGCCGPPFTHRNSLSGTGSDPSAPQRYAIDFLQLDDQLQSFAGDPARNESYFIFGAEVSAVAPGRVVAVRDGLPENTPGVPPEVAAGDGPGNFVVQDLGEGRLALYSHLRTGSISVRPGDEVAPGQRLGAVGNNGRSSEPHLHFQVMDGGTDEGLPYVFDAFRLEGRIAGLDRTPPFPVVVPAPPAHREAQLPLTGDLVSFR